MKKHRGVSSKLDFKNIPFFHGLEQLASEGFIPSGSKRNHDHVSGYCKYSDRITTTQRLMLSDSQTSGGLLISIPDKEADDYVNTFNSKSEIKAHIIGKITSQSSELVEIY